MIPGQEDTELEGLTLGEVLRRDDLCVQQVLSIAGIHGKIRLQMRVFMEHCSRNESFAERLITLGLKCPMHQSTSPQMKNLTFIAADILTSDHDAVADWLLPITTPQDQTDGEAEIAEEIEIEEREETPSESDRYKWLGRVLEYLMGEDLDENCVNYIAKTLQVVIRKRLGALLEYMRACPDVLAKLAHLSHFPAIAQILAKFITDEDEHMSESAHEARKMVIPLLLQKLHKELALPSSAEVLDCLEQILQASRYSDPQEPYSELQNLSNMIVSFEEIKFHLDALLPVSPATYNAASYLLMAVNREVLDESEGMYNATLRYRNQLVFTSFAKLAKETAQLAGADRLLIIKWLELLVSIAKFSYFGNDYKKIPREERLQAIRVMVWGIARGQFSGVALQMACTVVESAVLLEERIAESHPDPAVKLSPNELYCVLSDHQLHLQELVQSLAKQAPRQRNRNEQGVFLRKLLVVLDNFFKNSEIHRHFPEIQAVTALFPTFTPGSCREYAQGATISNHPAGLRAKLPLQFGFIRRNKACLDSMIKVDEVELPQSLPIETVQVQEEPKKLKENGIVLKLPQKIRTLKDRVKEKQGQKQGQQKPKEQTQTQTVHKEAQNPKAAIDAQIENKSDVVLSPSKQKSPMPCLLFFVRHLTIY